MSFNPVKDFEYLLVHPNAAEIFQQILAFAKVIRQDDYDCITRSETDLWVVTFDRMSGITRYRLTSKSSGVKEDFDDLGEVIAAIAARWW
jgi:hypothetical protein